MKKLIMINGTMGVGKTATSRELQKMLNNCVFLDGDWCWDMHPFIVNEETKHMVLDNIVYMLNNFLHCNTFEHIIFCWVMHEQSIIDYILSRIDVSLCDVQVYSLLCREDVLKERLSKDIINGIREEDILVRTIARLPLYDCLDTIKVDVSELSIAEAANQIYLQIGHNKSSD